MWKSQRGQSQGQSPSQTSSDGLCPGQVLECCKCGEWTWNMESVICSHCGSMDLDRVLLGIEKPNGRAELLVWAGLVLALVWLVYLVRG